MTFGSSTAKYIYNIFYTTCTLQCTTTGVQRTV